ncbi:hypothetical protein [Methanogenium cariaci]|uniref:hypothetical protein n=1 Tax=Methanogenium cariaci TaxID=2197 RepID=UPI0007813B6E|nr:hypothetical protein [Methanogenium cariaci]
MENTVKAVDYRLIRNDVFIVEVEDKDTRSAISGADVYIDGIFFGETNAEGGKVTSFVERERSHTIRITTDEYLAYSDDVYIASDVLVYSAELSKTLYPVTISVYGLDKIPVGGEQQLSLMVRIPVQPMTMGGPVLYTWMPVSMRCRWQRKGLPRSQNR